MKPKLNRLICKSLPLMIVLPAMLQQLHAGTITSDAAGNVTVPSGFIPVDSTVLANGGTSLTPTVTVNSGAVLTGDSVLQDAVRINAANYRVINNGSLTGLNQGIDSLGQVVTVTNSGSITGTTAEGIRSLGGLSLITNNSGGTISGGNDAIFFSTNGGIVNNNGTITGLTSLNSDGIDAATGAAITNAGTITGNRHGLNLIDDATVTNNLGGTIRGITGNGINAGLNATVVNNFGATIVSNNSVTGEDAIQLSSGIVTNRGTLLGGNFIGDSGIQANGGGLSQINNSGTIDAFQGITLLGTTNDIITNSGSITGNGGSAISGNGGANVINLLDGSSVIGSIDGGLGADTINFTGGTTSRSDSSANIVQGNISAETLNISGPGTISLSGVGSTISSVVADSINLNSGNLILNANLSEATPGGSPALISTQAGTLLGGTGTWNSTVTLNQAGIGAGPVQATLTLAPTNAIGTLNLNGNVTQVGSQNWIEYDVQPQAGNPILAGISADVINHTGGTYDLGTASQIRIAPTSVNSALSDGVYTVIDSNSAIVGNLPSAILQFNGAADTGLVGTLTGGSQVSNSVLINEFTTVSRINGNSDLVFTVAHNYAGLAGLTENQSALGSAIDASVTNTNAAVQDFIAALDFSDLATVQATLASLDPTYNLNLASSVMNSNYRMHRLAQEHLAVVRGSSEMTTTTAASTQDSKGGMVAGQTTTSYSASQGNLWGSASYDRQDYNTAGSSADYDGDIGAVTFGFDWRLAPEFVLGIMFDGSQGSYDGQSLENTDIDSYRGAIYGTYGSSVGFYSDFLAGYGTHNFDSTRNFGGILSGNNPSDSDADGLQALLTFGYSMTSGAIKHGPYIGAEYQKLNVDGFTQASPVPVTVNDYDIKSLRGLVGYRMTADCGTFRPYASATYAYEFEDGQNEATASFAGAPFTVRGAEQSSAVLVTAGTNIVLTASLLLDVGYRGDIATDEGLTSHGATVGLNYSF